MVALRCTHELGLARGELRGDGSGEWQLGHGMVVIRQDPRQRGRELARGGACATSSTDLTS